MKNDYSHLREQYPDTVGLEQLREICKIAKRSAKYLLDHDIVPNENSGKKTRQYKILLEDIITYLQAREKWGSQIPRGAVSSDSVSKSTMERGSFAMVIRPGMEKDIADYFQYIYADSPENLSLSDVREMTGLSKESIRRCIHSGALKSLQYGNRYVVPKCWLMDFVTSPPFLASNTGSPTFKKILGGFQLWKDKKRK